MSEALLLTVAEQVDAHEKKIIELNEKTAHMLDYAERLDTIRNSIENLQSDIHKLSLPQKEIQQLSDKLEGATQMFRQPLKQTIVHHHHASRLIWATGILFLMVCLLFF